VQGTPPAAPTESPFSFHQRRSPSPYGPAWPATTPEAMARIFAAHSPRTPTPEGAAPRYDALRASAGGPSPTQQPSPEASPWAPSTTSPYLTRPEGYQYQQMAAGDPAAHALPKYHFSLSWTSRGPAEGGVAAPAPSGPQQVDEVLFRLGVDRNGLRCGALLCTYLQMVVSPTRHEARLLCC
jgi:hypothetical protein